MFSFLFKRTSKKITAIPEKEQQQQESRAASAEQKAFELAQAEALAGNEAAAVEFILQSAFADARLKAAQHVHSKDWLEKVLQAMRNSDRRVAKLMQQRLDVLVNQEENRKKAESWIQQAQMLTQHQHFLPSQLAEIDLGWSKLQDVPEVLRNAFEANRSILQNRVVEQTNLQRSALETRNRLRAITQTLTAQEPPENCEEVVRSVESLESEINHYHQANEATSLPRNLLGDLAQELEQAKRGLDRLNQRITAIAAHENAYAKWEAMPADILQAEVIKRESRVLPQLQEEDKPAFEQRLNRLLERITPAKKENKKENTKNNARLDNAQLDDKSLLSALEQLEQDLEDGALQQAIEQEKILKSSDMKTLKWSGDRMARLTKARSELARLQSWARWGGHVSREELIKAAEALPEQEVEPAELAKKVGSLRAYWKSMDGTSGPSSKELWLRFDEACTKAYAPVTEHFARLAAERKLNLQKAHAIIAETEAFAESELKSGDSDAVDWKKISSFRSRMLQAWRETGHIDRKEKKQADIKFAEVIRLLSEPLTKQQQLKVQEREEMIAEVAQLNPSDRHSIESIRLIQQRWQQHAKNLSLERQDEQRLWQKFRGVCDKFFEERQAAMQESDSAQQTNFEIRQRLCEMLESQAEASPESLAGILKEVEIQWREIGPVPRRSEQAIQRRYQAAVSALNSRIREVRRLARKDQFARVSAKLALCYAAEEKIEQPQRDMKMEAARLQDQWQQLEVSNEFDKGLAARFESALAAMKNGSQDYASLLQKNRAALERNLLLLEILLEMESPSELFQDRLKLQVEILQSSLKAGKNALTPLDVLHSILESPALNDESTFKRTDKLIRHMGHASVDGA